MVPETTIPGLKYCSKFRVIPGEFRRILRPFGSTRPTTLDSIRAIRAGTTRSWEEGVFSIRAVRVGNDLSERACAAPSISQPDDMQ